MTDAEIKVALNYLITVTETVREAREIPEGIVYAALMDRMDINAFNSMIGVLIKSGLVTRSNAHLLTWVGPEVQ